MTRKDRPDNLREACIAEAMTIIETVGLEELSMREVARRLGISHQAPYRHFASRDHILAEIVRRSFEDFARHLDARPHTTNPQGDLSAMGHACVQYAVEHPLQYRLMFGTPLPDPQQHPEMMQNAQYAFSLLRAAIARMALSSPPELDALFVWSTMHGLASLIHMQLITTLGLSAEPLEHIIQHVIGHIGTGLNHV